MLTFTNKLTAALPYQFDPNLSIQPSDLLFFDIETTGLSADVSSVYLIGCCFYENNCWNLIQWFADDYISEKTLLKEFIQFSSRYRVIVHFNGSGFDIPYLEKKMKHHQIAFCFSDFLSIDLYKKIKPYKTLLHLPNVKQKSVENFIGIHREDEYSGGELIEVYTQYMKSKFARTKDLNPLLHKLLLHNAEDVSNLILLSSVLSYSALFESRHTVTKAYQQDFTLYLEFTLKNPIKNPIFYETEEIALSVCNQLGSLRIKTFQGECKYFYPNYKDYYYLPLEDTAIHKSVAQFVDKEHKVKAKAATCYIKKQGVFIPQFTLGMEPKFQINVKDKTTFLELTDSFLSDNRMLSDYVSILLKTIVHEAKHLSK